MLGSDLALALPLLCIAVGCTYADTEPGLFGHESERPTAAPATTTRPSSAPLPSTNPDLPVVGETTWTSGDGLDVTFRIAVHAVRRMAGATILDWSVTPLRARNLRSNDQVPASVNLGLYRVGEANVNVFLLDGQRRVYRPLAHRDPGPAACLCTPIWLAEGALRIGHTALLQDGFPVLPPDVATVDVDVSTVPPFPDVPVTPIGMVPRASGPTDLTTIPGRVAPVATTAKFAYQPGRQQFIILIDAIYASPRYTAVAWTIQTVSGGGGIVGATEPPIVGDQPPFADYNRVTASGPQLVPKGSSTTLRARLATTRFPGQGALECLCSDLRIWSGALHGPDESISVATVLPPVPEGTLQVDVTFPGLATLHGIDLMAVSGGGIRSAEPVRGEVGTWN